MYLATLMASLSSYSMAHQAVASARGHGVRCCTGSVSG
jgi:hypothetical protein